MEQIFLSALMGVLTFISPCVLPMLPVFVTYFAAGESNKKRTLINVLGFCLALMIVLTLIGALISAVFAGFARFIVDKRVYIDIVTGCIVAFMGLVFMDIIPLPFLKGASNISVKTEGMRFFSAFLFGLVYSISFGPCVASFGSFTIMQGITEAIETGKIAKAIIMQLTFSGTMAVLFIISALLIDTLKGVFDFIKKHYKVINLISGSILVLLGILMATGVMRMFGDWLSSLSLVGII